jgi:DNA-binding NtrC family response regulator
MKSRILVVDDEDIVLKSCVRALADADHEVETVDNGAAALERIGEGRYDVVVLDIMMPGVGGLEVLQRAKEAHPDVEIIMVTGLSQIDTAVKSMKLGAFDYVPKPFDPDELKLTVERAIERRRLLRENVALKTEVAAHYRFDNIVGSSPRMQDVFRAIAQCAPTNSTVLVTGESGTGKELVARAIHYNSLRRDKPIVTVDCTSLAETLLESELFGHVKGSFTGAVANKRGLLEVAQGGTVFLDEIGNIPLAIQAKLLRVIQEREFRAVGDTRTQEANIRIVAATNKDLKEMVAAGTFRDDLYYRINIFPLRLPALRERREDIPALAFHFLKACAQEVGKKVDQISDGAMSVLVNYDWPGNVRELENMIHRAVILTADNVVRKAHFAALAGPGEGDDVPRSGEELKRTKKEARNRSVEGIERAFVLEALKRNAWNVTRSAEETGMQRANFQALMKKHNIRLRSQADAKET